jgi:hypothetical protein
MQNIHQSHWKPCLWDCRGLHNNSLQVTYKDEHMTRMSGVITFECHSQSIRPSALSWIAMTFQPNFWSNHYTNICVLSSCCLSAVSSHVSNTQHKRVSPHGNVSQHAKGHSPKGRVVRLKTSVPTRTCLMQMPHWNKGKATLQNRTMACPRTCMCTI